MTEAKPDINMLQKEIRFLRKNLERSEANRLTLEKMWDRNSNLFRTLMEEIERQKQLLIEAAELREDVERITRHDLKTPLNAVIGGTDIIMMDGGLTEEQIQWVDIIRSSGYAMLDMIDRSLDMYKMETGVYQFEPEPVDILEVFRKISVELNSTASAKQVTLKMELGGEEPAEGQILKVFGEPLLCYSLFANLIKNAIEASPEGETVEITLSGGIPRVACISNRGAVPEEIRDRFFEKYVTSGKKTGTGLGTYSARLIAETMGDTISLSSSEEEGTVITVHLNPAE